VVGCRCGGRGPWRSGCQWIGCCGRNAGIPRWGGIGGVVDRWRVDILERFIAVVGISGVFTFIGWHDAVNWGSSINLGRRLDADDADVIGVFIGWRAYVRDRIVTYWATQSRSNPDTAQQFKEHPLSS
jgi:hypothetical protein